MLPDPKHWKKTGRSKTQRGSFPAERRETFKARGGGGNLKNIKCWIRTSNIGKAKPQRPHLTALSGQFQQHNGDRGWDRHRRKQSWCDWVLTHRAWLGKNGGKWSRGRAEGRCSYNLNLREEVRAHPIQDRAPNCTLLLLIPTGAKRRAAC